MFNTHKDNAVSHSLRPLLEKNNDTFVRYNNAITIIDKISKQNEKSFSTIVSPQTPFGLYSSFNDFSTSGPIKVYANKKIGYIGKDYIISKNANWIDKWKVYAPKAIGSGELGADKVKAFIGEPNSICTQTYIMYGPFKDKNECENVISYVNTKFFHFLMGLKKVTQDAMAKVYTLIPMQDFSKPWTDQELYAKYNLTDEEINFIENMIKPME